MTKRKRINDMPSSKAMWLVECSRFPPTTFVIVTNQKCQLYRVRGVPRKRKPRAESITVRPRLWRSLLAPIRCVCSLAPARRRSVLLCRKSWTATGCARPPEAVVPVEGDRDGVGDYDRISIEVRLKRTPAWHGLSVHARLPQ